MPVNPSEIYNKLETYEKEYVKCKLRNQKYGYGLAVGVVLTNIATALSKTPLKVFAISTSLLAIGTFAYMRSAYRQLNITYDANTLAIESNLSVSNKLKYSCLEYGRYY